MTVTILLSNTSRLSYIHTQFGLAARCWRTFLAGYGSKTCKTHKATASGYNNTGMKMQIFIDYNWEECCSECHKETFYFPNTDAPVLLEPSQKKSHIYRWGFGWGVSSSCSSHGLAQSLQVQNRTYSFHLSWKIKWMCVYTENYKLYIRSWLCPPPITPPPPPHPSIPSPQASHLPLHVSFAESAGHIHRLGFKTVIKRITSTRSKYFLRKLLTVVIVILLENRSQTSNPISHLYIWDLKRVNTHYKIVQPIWKKAPAYSGMPCIKVVRSD